MFKAGPDLGLPTAVEAFDGRLKSHFVRRGEDRSDLEAETESDHAADGVRVLPRSCEAVVVVELSIAWKAHVLPMAEEGLEDELGGDLALGPHGGETSEQGNSRENRQCWPATDGQAFDGVEAVEFRSLGSDGGEVPALGRSRPTDAFAAVEEAVSGQDAADGAYAGKRFGASLLQLAMDCRGAVLAKDAALLELLPESQHASFGGRVGSMDSLGGTGTVLPLDAIQSLTRGASDPVLDCGKGYPVGARHRSHRVSLPHVSDHLATLLGRQGFLA